MGGGCCELEGEGDEVAEGVVEGSVTLKQGRKGVGGAEALAVAVTPRGLREGVSEAGAPEASALAEAEAEALAILNAERVPGPMLHASTRSSALSFVAPGAPVR